MDLILKIFFLIRFLKQEDLVEISIRQDSGGNLLSIVIRDNGQGMDRRVLEGARDPFVTTRTTRRVGLGLSLLAWV